MHAHTWTHTYTHTRTYTHTLQPRPFLPQQDMVLFLVTRAGDRAPGTSANSNQPLSGAAEQAPGSIGGLGRGAYSKRQFIGQRTEKHLLWAAVQPSCCPAKGRLDTAAGSRSRSVSTVCHRFPWKGPSTEAQILSHQDVELRPCGGGFCAQCEDACDGRWASEPVEADPHWLV